MRQLFGALSRRTTPKTSYPFSSSSSARYEPSCPVMPVMIARLAMKREFYAKCLRQRILPNTRQLSKLRGV